MTRPLTVELLEAAVCESEVAGSGHGSDEHWDEGGKGLIRACTYHRATENERIRRLVDALAMRDVLPLEVGRR